MRFHPLWLFSFLTITEGQDSFLEWDDGIKTKRELIVNKQKPPGSIQEYELLLQVHYRNSKEKRELTKFLKFWVPYSFLLPQPVKIIRAKATTYCGYQNGVLRCACEDSYSWFPPQCLDPQNCSLLKAGSLQSCDCHPSNLTQSVYFCERTKVWGTFKINEKFTEDLLDSSSAMYAKYATGIEMQLKEAYKEIQGFESVRVTQFREGSIVVGYEVVGSSNTYELLSGIEQMCNSIAFGFGSENDEYTLPCSRGYIGSITVRCQSSGWRILREMCVLSELEELKKNLSELASNNTDTEAAVSSLVQKLAMVIQQSPSTTAGNLASVVSILGGISSLKESFTVSNLTMENVINIADHILNSASLTNWTVLLQKEKDASSQLLASLENISALVPSTALPLNFSRDFINWKGIPVSANLSNQSYNYETEFPHQNTPSPITGHVFIGPGQFKKHFPYTIISMTSLTLGNILPIAKNTNAQVNGPLISVIIPNSSIDEISLTFSKMKLNLSQPHCVFWDFSHLQWRDTGCHLENETANSVTCLCTHLTSFSVLMSPIVPPAIVPIVKWITFVGLGVSIGSLILCLTIEGLFWKRVNKNQTSHSRHICIVNIALCLLIADVWFIVAATVDSTANSSGICTAAVFFAHFFYLSLFFWMLLLGFLLAYRVIFVFHHMATPLMVAVGFCLGYGCPLIISIVTIAVTQPSNGYKRKDACWLNWSNGSKPLLAFAVPALTVVAVNLAVVLLVLTKLWRPAIGERLAQDNKVTVMRIGRSLLILTPLLGLTWGFGIATMLRQLLLNKLSPLSCWDQAPKQKLSDSSVKLRFEKTFNPFQPKGHYVFSYTRESSHDIMLTQFSSVEQSRES
ncbi:ADGRF1 [Cervus elaphus hippelaphus]|uniref:ADGRF1 n=1 Tax=Cervus elaphus hippelaphus TaxID=46360 RepID=A0A212D4I3_CEREH|nr:ADGRF1 [Cervus elaphus hippelaphus]